MKFYRPICVDFDELRAEVKEKYEIWITPYDVGYFDDFPIVYFDMNMDYDADDPRIVVKKILREQLPENTQEIWILVED